MNITTTTRVGQFDQLRREVDELRDDLAALREELAGEVRTRRLVVVDERGRERIASSTGDDFAQIEVSSIDMADDRGQPSARVCMYAGTEGAEGEHSGSVYVAADDELVATIDGDSRDGADGRREAFGAVSVAESSVGANTRRAERVRRITVTPRMIHTGWKDQPHGRVRFEYHPGE